jgi:predicted dehydrogenase
MQSLRAGKHVLCEKPMAMNTAESRAMIEAAHACNRTLAAAYYRRTYPKMNRAKELIAGGVIGQPVIAELTSHSWFDGLLSDGKQSARTWLLDPAQAGGGPLFDIASHRIDVLNYLFGQPLRVTGQLSNAVHHYAVEDNATVLIEYADGVRGVVDVRWHSKVSRDECRIRGTEGEIDLTPLNGPELRWPGGGETLAPHPNLHFPIIENFVDAVLSGTTPLANGAASYWTDWVIEQVCEENSQ